MVERAKSEASRDLSNPRSGAEGELVLFRSRLVAGIRVGSKGHASRAGLQSSLLLTPSFGLVEAPSVNAPLASSCSRVSPLARAPRCPTPWPARRASIQGSPRDWYLNTENCRLEERFGLHLLRVPDAAHVSERHGADRSGTGLTQSWSEAQLSELVGWIDGQEESNRSLSHRVELALKRELAHDAVQEEIRDGRRGTGRTIPSRTSGISVVLSVSDPR